MTPVFYQIHQRVVIVICRISWVPIYIYGVFNYVLCICFCGAECHATRPMFGRSLESHLKQTEREVSVVIEECINILYRNALEEEVLTFMLSYNVRFMMCLHFQLFCTKLSPNFATRLILLCYVKTRLVV